MKFNMKTPILILIYFALGVAGVFAKTETNPSQPKGRIFTCFIWKDLNIAPVYYLEAGKMVEINFKRNTRSSVYKLPKTEVFKLFTQKEIEGELQYIAIGETKISSDVNRYLFIVGETKDNAELPLEITALNDSLEGFPVGSTKFYNLTSKPMSVDFNGTKAVIKPKSIQLVKPDIPSNGALIPIHIYYKDFDVIKSRLFSQSKERRILFIKPNPEKGTRRPVLVKFLEQLVGPSFTN